MIFRIKNQIFLLVLGIFILTPNALAQVDTLAQNYFREQVLRLMLKEYQDVKGIRIGQVASFKAMISQEGKYDSNIFLSSNDKKHDYISITSPNLLLDVPLGRDTRDFFQLMYRADIAAFSNYKSQNYVNQNVMAKTDLSFPWGYLNAQNDFKDTVDRASTEFTSQVRRNENLSQLVLGVGRNKLSYEAGYSHFLRNYRESGFDAFNYTEDVYSGTAFYQFFPKTRALLEYDYGVIDYPNDPTRNGDHNQIRTGFKVDLTGKTTGLVKVGYQQRNYDSAARGGFDGFVAETVINTVLSQRTSIAFTYLRTAVESISSLNNYFDLNSVGVLLTQKLIGNFTLLLGTQFDRREYPQVDPTANVKQRDSVLTEGITLQYQVKKLGRISLGYRYATDISNIDANKYNDNLISLKFDFLF